MAALEAAETAKYDLACEGDDCERYRFGRCRSTLYFSAAFYREVLDRFFSPAWQERYVTKLGGTLLVQARALPAGTRFAWPNEAAAARNCGDGPVPTVVGTTGMDRPLAPLPPSPAVLDIVGIKVGMPLDAATAAVKAHNPKLQIRTKNLQVTLAPGKVNEVPYLLSTRLAGKSAQEQLASAISGDQDHIDLLLSLGPGPAVVIAIHRDLQGLQVPLAIMRATLREKYGPPAQEEMNIYADRNLYWYFDREGQPIRQNGACQLDAGLMDVNAYIRYLDDPQQAKSAADRCGAYVWATLSMDSGRSDTVKGIGLTVSNEWLRAASAGAFRAYVAKFPGPGAPKL
jgi:hypothetical protein